MSFGEIRYPVCECPCFLMPATDCSQIAIALKGGELRDVGLANLAAKLGRPWDGRLRSSSSHQSCNRRKVVPS
eukprot:5345680-Prymnesium_polylepis.1